MTYVELAASGSARPVMALAISGGTPSHVFLAASRASNHACRSSLQHRMENIGSGTIRQE